MKIRRRFYYIFSFLLLISVATAVYLLHHYRHGFFQKTATGLHYRVVQRGKGPTPQAGEILLFHICYKTEKGIVLFDTTAQELPIALPYTTLTKAAEKDAGGTLEAISMLQKAGDRLLCKVSPEKLFNESEETLAATADQHGLKKHEKLLLHLHLQDIMTEEAYKKWETTQIAALQKKEQEQITRQRKEDDRSIANHLSKNKIEAQVTASGLYYVIDTPGKGVQPRSGDSVKVHYTGRLLDGKVFDTSLATVAKQHGIHNPDRTYGALSFQLGAGQVIQGWEEGILYLHQGTKARFFIPSTLAYGTQRVSNMIPSNAVLVYDVELVDVQR